ncbi:MAG: hypothetical protein EBR09_11830 [Proteobacteria bacterium]|nr:hypothetical protein [Pseudomonadota bacterium]
MRRIIVQTSGSRRAKELAHEKQRTVSENLNLLRTVNCFRRMREVIGCIFFCQNQRLISGLTLYDHYQVHVCPVRQSSVTQRRCIHGANHEKQ